MTKRSVGLADLFECKVIEPVGARTVRPLDLAAPGRFAPSAAVLAKQQQAETLRRRYADPAYKAAQAARIRAMHKDPAWRARWEEKMRAGVAQHKSRGKR